MIGIASVQAPWGPIRLAADEDAVVALDVLSTPDSFGAGCHHRLGEWPQPAADATPAVRRRLGQAAEAVTALLGGEPAAVAGIPIVCAVSAPSSLAVDAGRRFGMTLVGFLRGSRFNIYTNPERIT